MAKANPSRTILITLTLLGTLGAIYCFANEQNALHEIEALMCVLITTVGVAGLAVGNAIDAQTRAAAAERKAEWEHRQAAIAWQHAQQANREQ